MFTSMFLNAKDDQQVGDIYVTPTQSFDDEDSSLFYAPEPKRPRQNHPEGFVTPPNGSGNQFLLLPSLDVDSFDVESSDRRGGQRRFKLQMKHSFFGSAATQKANLVMEEFLDVVEDPMLENQEPPTITTGSAKPHVVGDPIIRKRKPMTKRMACNVRLV
jgi:hypothetical protein